MLLRGSLSELYRQNRFTAAHNDGIQHLQNVDIILVEVSTLMLPAEYTQQVLGCKRRW